MVRIAKSSYVWLSFVLLKVAASNHRKGIDGVRTDRSNSLVMLVLLGVSVFVYNFAAGIYFATGEEPLPTLEFLYQAAFLCGVVWWLQAEVVRSAVTPVYCSGVLVGLGWLFIIPYHLLKTRGFKGLIPLFALIGAFLAAHILALVVYAVFLWS